MKWVLLLLLTPILLEAGDLGCDCTSGLSGWCLSPVTCRCRNEKYSSTWRTCGNNNTRTPRTYAGDGELQLSCTYTDYYSDYGCESREREVHWYVKVDKSPPELSLELNPPEPDGINGWYRRSVEFVFDADDPHSGILALSRYQSGVPGIIPDTGPDGFVLENSATNRAGLVTLINRTIHVDSVAPAIPVSFQCGSLAGGEVPCPAYFVPGEFTFRSGPVPDIPSPVNGSSSGVRNTYMGIALEPACEPGFADHTNSDFWIPADNGMVARLPAGEDRLYLCMMAEDRAGNRSAAASFVLRMDTRPPVPVARSIRFASGSTTGWYTGRDADFLEASAMDAETRLARLQILAGDTLLIECVPGTCGWSSGSDTSVVIPLADIASGLDDGIHQLRLIWYDAAGNRSESALELKTDRTPPCPAGSCWHTLNREGLASFRIPSPEVYFSTYDGTGSGILQSRFLLMECRFGSLPCEDIPVAQVLADPSNVDLLPAGSGILLESGDTVALSGRIAAGQQGIFGYCLEHTDVAGWTSVPDQRLGEPDYRSSDCGLFALDSEAPLAPVTDVPVFRNSPLLRILWSEPTGRQIAPLRYLYLKEGSAPAHPADAPGPLGGVYPVSPVLLAELPGEGEFTFHLWAEDAAGNRSVHADHVRTFTVLADFSAPEFSLPDLRIAGDVMGLIPRKQGKVYARPDAVLSWTFPVVSDPYGGGISSGAEWFTQCLGGIDINCNSYPANADGDKILDLRSLSLTEGTSVLWWRARDRAGNEHRLSEELILDSQPPCQGGSCALRIQNALIQADGSSLSGTLPRIAPRIALLTCGDNPGEDCERDGVLVETGITHPENSALIKTELGIGLGAFSCTGCTDPEEAVVWQTYSPLVNIPLYRSGTLDFSLWKNHGIMPERLDVSSGTETVVNLYLRLQDAAGNISTEPVFATIGMDMRPPLAPDIIRIRLGNQTLSLLADGSYETASGEIIESTNTSRLMQMATRAPVVSLQWTNKSDISGVSASGISVVAPGEERIPLTGGGPAELSFTPAAAGWYYLWLQDALGNPRAGHTYPEYNVNSVNCRSRFVRCLFLPVDRDAPLWTSVLPADLQPDANGQLVIPPAREDHAVRLQSGLSAYIWCFAPVPGGCTRTINTSLPEVVVPDSDGEWFFSVLAMDSAGNSSPSVYGSYVRDVEPPCSPGYHCMVDYPASTSSRSFTIRMHAQDAVSEEISYDITEIRETPEGCQRLSAAGIVSVPGSCAGSLFTPAQSQPLSGTGTLTLTEEGPAIRQFEVRFRDQAGHWSVPFRRAVVIDTLPPPPPRLKPPVLSAGNYVRVQIDPEPDAGFNPDPETRGIRGVYITTAVPVRPDEGIWIATDSWPVYAEVPVSGTGTLYLRSVDLAGNQSLSDLTRIPVVLDTDGPVVLRWKFTGPPVRPVLEADVVDPGSGVAEVSAWMCRETCVPFRPGQTIHPGEYTFFLEARDQLGNITRTEQTSYLVPVSAPVFNPDPPLADPPHSGEGLRRFSVRLTDLSGTAPDYIVLETDANANGDYEPAERTPVTYSGSTELGVEVRATRSLLVPLNWSPVIRFRFCAGYPSGRQVCSGEGIAGITPSANVTELSVADNVIASGKARIRIPSGVNEIRIYDSSGQVVRTLAAGGGISEWNATNESGHRVAPGRYTVVGNNWQQRAEVLVLPQ